MSIKPGIWTIIKTAQGFSLVPTTFTKENILEEYVVTEDINVKIDNFFDNTEVYKKYGIFPKRGGLLYGLPGCGKSCAITNVANHQIKNKKIAIVVWHTDKYEASEVSSFIKAFEYVKHGVERFILIVEDIGGVEMGQVRMKSDSSLLSLLDNVENTFKIPTYVVATTNHISNFLDNLTNRPGRFDDKIHIQPPPAKARGKFLEFFSNNEADKDALAEIIKPDYNEFSIAHVKEAFIRSKIYKLALTDSIKRVKEEIELYKKAFVENKQKPGINWD